MGMNVDIQKRLDGRVACWHAYMGGALTREECEAAALAHWGYASAEALAADYPAPAEDEAPWSSEGLPTPLLSAFKNAQAPDAAQGAQWLRDLAAYASAMDVGTYDLSLTGRRLSWKCDGYDHSQKVSASIGAALLADLHLDAEEIGRGIEISQNRVTLHGKIRVVYTQVRNKVLLSLCCMFPPLAECAEEVPQDIETVGPILARLVALRRSEQVTPDTEIRVTSRNRVRP